MNVFCVFCSEPAGDNEKLPVLVAIYLDEGEASKEVIKRNAERKKFYYKEVWNAK